MKLQPANTTFKAQIELPGSKSISNRALMIDAYSKSPQTLNALSDADDTVMLQRNLEFIRNCHHSAIPMVIDCGNAGTVFRFLLTYLASTEGHWMLTGSVRMKSRPVSDLVDALRQLGADIEYVENEGFSPLKIYGKKLKGGRTTVSMQKSSQFASSLLMAAPTWTNGLELSLAGKLNSMPYLEMTLQMMEHFGAKLNRNDRMINVLPFDYHANEITIEPDWSSAAFWYELVALSNKGELLLKGLKLSSLQGDRQMVEMFHSLGVASFEEPDGVLIFKTDRSYDALHFDLTGQPDMLPALVATCAALAVEAVFTGLENLKYKESDRTLALQEQMALIGGDFRKLTDEKYHLKPQKKKKTAKNLLFRTYADHRMAMAFAPLSLVLGVIEIEQPEVVEKSYPQFWNQLFATAAVERVEV